MVVSCAVSNCFERAYVDNFTRIESKLGRNERVLDRSRKDISTMRNETIFVRKCEFDNRLYYQKHENNFTMERIEILRRENNSICVQFALCTHDYEIVQNIFQVCTNIKIKRIRRFFEYTRNFNTPKKRPILQNQTQLNPLRTNPSMDHHSRDVPLSRIHTYPPR